MASPRFRPAFSMLAAMLTVASLAAAPPDAAAKKRRSLPTGPTPEALAVASLKPPQGFRVELVHAVPRETEGSWVSMTVDPKGRLYVSDQFGKLYRVVPSKLGAAAAKTKVEPVDVAIGGAHGLLWAFDSLYVMNNEAQGGKRGLYRVRDTNGDDRLDQVELLRAIDGGGEHGPHAVVLGPDGTSLYVVAGNATRLPELAASRVPRLWGEDNLIPHMPDGAGFMAGEKAPGGWICKVDPDGKRWELVAMGFRNPYDIAFNRDGELFTYDSDMEWDMNMPWYRPTRVCHVTSGADFGYRNGSGKWPPYYFDSLPPVVDIGPGSPTGVTFGYGAKFPRKYEQALFLCDWSYGKLYALHLSPKGASYAAELEEFLQGSPLPLTDIVVNRHDGALYFTVGGRRTASGLYRVVYESPILPSESRQGTEEAQVSDSRTFVREGLEAPFSPATARSLRHAIEALHGERVSNGVEMAWGYLDHTDRFIAYAARAALESQPVALWRDRALAEKAPAKALPALLALIRASASDPDHRKPADPPPDSELKARILAALDPFASPGNMEMIHQSLKLELVRVYQVFFNRFGKPEPATAEKLNQQLGSGFPSKSRELNAELAELLVYLEAPDAASKLLHLLAAAPTQEEQLEYAKDLRRLKTGWTPTLRIAYFAWFQKAAGFKGGNSLRGFLKQIRDESLSHLSDAEKAPLQPILDAQLPAAAVSRPAVPAQPFVKNWTLDELVPLVEANRSNRDFDRGHTLFAAASCFSCHRFAGEGGGAGPDLSGLAGRFTTRDLLESIVLPSKVISDQYGAVMIATSDGQVVTGRVVNLSGDSMSVCTNMLDPNTQVHVDRRKIEEIKPSPISMMPEGLLNTLDRDEVLDLVAYLLSRGDRNAPLFRKP